MRIDVLSHVKDGATDIVNFNVVFQQADGISGNDAEQLVKDAFVEAQAKLRAKANAALAALKLDPELERVSKQLGVSPLQLARYNT